MTEAEWLVCADADKMIPFLRERVSDRKWRLFAAACNRQFWSRIGDVARASVEVAERRADGAATEEEMAFFRNLTLTGHDRETLNALGLMGTPADPDADPLAAHALWVEPAVECALLRDLLGPLPFRAVTVDPAWLRWSDGTIPKLAQAIYADRSFGDLPILANALEEAGCDNADILAHCRQPGEHVRGCWVVDLLLGRGL